MTAETNVGDVAGPGRWVPPRVVRADSRALPLPDDSVDLIVTSPPYFGLRSYTDHGRPVPGQLGAEATPTEYRT